MFTPMAGPLAGLSFFETFLSCLFGGVFSVSVFYFLGNSITEYHQRYTARKIERALKKDRKVKLKKRFTKTNRTIIRLKQRLNFFMACWLIPLFFSLPIGSLVIAKFFRHQKRVFMYLLIGVFINCFLITSGTYLVYFLVRDV